MKSLWTLSKRCCSCPFLGKDKHRIRSVTKQVLSGKNQDKEVTIPVVSELITWSCVSTAQNIDCRYIFLLFQFSRLLINITKYWLRLTLWFFPPALPIHPNSTCFNINSTFEHSCTSSISNFPLRKCVSDKRMCKKRFQPECHSNTNFNP